ncbi:ESPR-type extended signal peptide-containing protein, partial [Glaesserella parasuis]|uniref:ESPR-type extended signal peptide-containing protein n=1 Tax=Glaesserella parasuis TaxID=738 RepID=UPI003B681804
MNKIFRVIWSHAQQAWVVVSELVKSHTKTSAYTDKRAQVCTSDYFLDKQQDKFKLSLLSLVLLGIFFSPSAAANATNNAKPYLQDEAETSSLGYDDGTIGIGKKSKAGYGAVAIGQKAKAEGRHNIAIGYDSNAGTEVNSIAIGNNTVVSGKEAVAIGSASKAGKGSVVLGRQASAANIEQAVVIGHSTVVDGKEAVAIGKKSKAGKGSVVLGSDASAEKVEQAVVIGHSATASKAKSIVIGANAKADGYGSISIGGDDLKTTRYQPEDTTQGQVQSQDESKKTTASGGASIAIGGGSLAKGEGSIVLGPLASASKDEGIAIGANSKSTYEYGIAVGGSATANGKYAVALGWGSKGVGTDSIAIGKAATTAGAFSVVVGAHIDVTGQNLVVVGSQATAESHATALGYKASAGGMSSVAVGDNAKTNGSADRATALGNNTVVTVGGGVALGYGSNASTKGGVVGLKQAHSVTTGESTDANGFKSTESVDGNKIGAVSVGLAGNKLIKRQITNVAAGTQLTDAVNVAQLKSLTMKIGGDTSDSQPKVGLWDGTLKVKGDNGITSHANGDTITVKLKPDVKNKIDKIDGLETKINKGITFKGDGITQTDSIKLGETLKVEGRDKETVVTAQNKKLVIGLDIDVINKLAQIDAKMSSFKIKTNKDNNEAKIEDGDTIQFIAGDNIKITRNNKNLNFAVTSGMFGSTTDGRLSKQTEGLATVEAVVSAVNNAGWKLMIAKGVGQETPPAAHLIKMGDTATFTAGNNIKLEQNNGNITISTIIGKLITKTEMVNGDLKITYTDGSTDTIAKGKDGKNGAKGDKGEQGPPGVAGPRGEAGPKGEPGQAGPAGPRGPAGPTGAQGPAGARGEQGLKGDTGPVGPAGPKGETGSAGPAGADGTSIVQKDAEGNDLTTTVKADGVTATDKDSKNTVNADGMTVGPKDENQTDKSAATYNRDGVTVKGNDGADAITLTSKEGQDGKTTNTLALKGENGKDAVSITSGADGTAPEISFAKNGEGTDAKGTGSITGLKDVERNPDGTAKDRTAAANTGYVDDRLKEMNDRKPFEYFEKDSVTGEVKTETVNGKQVPVTLVRGKDGKFYKESDLKGKVFDPATNTYKNADGRPATLTEVASNNVTVQAMPSDASNTPIAMSNVGSGLGLKDDAESNKTALTPTDAQKAIAGDNKDGKGGLLAQTGNALNNVATVKDLQAIAQAGLDLTGNNADTTVHRPLGTKLTVEGEGKWNGKDSAANNLYVEAQVADNKLVVKMNRDLTNLNSVTLGTATMTGDKNTINLTGAGEKVEEEFVKWDPVTKQPILDENGNLQKYKEKVDPRVKLSGIADGDISPNSTDAVNGRQVYVLTDRIRFFHTNDGHNAEEQINHKSNTVDSRATGSYSTAVGYKAHAKGDRAVAFGNSTLAGIQSVAIGNVAIASGEKSIAIGDNAKAVGNQSISIGTGNVVNGNNSGAFGDPSVINADNSYSVGNNNTIENENVFALGNKITNTTSNSVFLGTNSGYVAAGATTAGAGALESQVTGGVYNAYAGGKATEVKGVVSVGNVNSDGTMETRRIQNVAPGLISEQSTDAINGSQLYNVAHRLGAKLEREGRQLR